MVAPKKVKDAVKKLEDTLNEAEQLGLVSKDEAEKVRQEASLKKKKGIALSAWDRVQIARAPDRPKADQYMDLLFDDFIEFKGDRRFLDDQAIVGGVAKFQGEWVTVIAQQKGKDTEDNIKRNFGMPNPEGYRKAIRLAKQAQKFNRPILCFIDTPGANPGVGAEERGQAEAIAKSLMVFSDLRVPIISTIISEGGSGGALALAVCDKLIMLENAVYSILSPEGFSSILWKDPTKANEAAEMMKMTAADIKENGLCDIVVKEPVDGAQEDIKKVAKALEKEIEKALAEFKKVKPDKLISDRYNKYRKFGKFTQ